jgi:hypothetical protein
MIGLTSLFLLTTTLSAPKRFIGAEEGATVGVEPGATGGTKQPLRARDNKTEKLKTIFLRFSI